MRGTMMFLAVLIAAFFSTSTAVHAVSQQPDVEYSADSYMETAQGVMKGPIYVAPGKERREYVEGGEKMAMVIRHDKKVVWMLMPDDKMYMETKFPKEGRKDDLGNYKIDQTTVGPDTVNGIKATKSKIIMTNLKTGEKMGGFWWATKEGIIVKTDVIAVDKNSKERIKSELKELKIGRQDPSLFEIPTDYTKMDMGMGGIGKMLGGHKGKSEGDGGDDGGDDSQDDGKQPQDTGKKKGFGLKDAIDLFK
jgi:outer membrane lipoprotein-sorting protein